MIRRVLMFLILVTHAVSDYCERYTFEENFDEWLIHEWGGACITMPNWVVGKYSDLNLTGQNKLSTSFITPSPYSAALPELSCVSSFIFSMNLGGAIDVNIYMEPTDPSDQVIVIANLLDNTGGDRVTGMEVLSAIDPSLMTGWHTLTMTLTGSETYDGYISIMGMAAPESIVLVDSFRYIPPGMDESECQLYEEIEITTPDPITVATPDPITTPIPDPITTPIPDPITTPIPDPITTTTPIPVPNTTHIPDPITTTSPIPDPITTTTPILEPNTTPIPDPITTTTQATITTTTSIPEPNTTPETTTITTVTASETTTVTITSMGTGTDSDDTEASTPYPFPTPPINNEDTKGFWTPLTITMLALLYLIVLTLVCLLFYEIGRRRAKIAAVADNFDFESLPTSFKIPRIKTVWRHANTNPYARRNSW